MANTMCDVSPYVAPVVLLTDCAVCCHDKVSRYNANLRGNGLVGRKRFSSDLHCVIQG